MDPQFVPFLTFLDFADAEIVICAPNCPTVVISSQIGAGQFFRVFLVKLLVFSEGRKTKGIPKNIEKSVFQGFPLKIQGFRKSRHTHFYSARQYGTFSLITLCDWSNFCKLYLRLVGNKAKRVLRIFWFFWSNF
jgi:hypothetical protein